MSYAENLSERAPEEIESRIAHTRKSLDRKLERLGERLDPRTRMQELKHGLRDGVSAHTPQYVAWAAVGAIATGAWLARRGWARLHSSEMYVSPDHPALTDSGEL